MNEATSPVIGIDLGTTNSVVAVYLDGQVRVLEEEGSALLPSVVGLTVDGKLITGTPARNQLIAFPDRTIASVKRRMGEAIRLKMADQEYSPQEISAMILRRLRDRAERAVGQPVSRAVITVPAFFDEDQRQATREAGELAGLQVERIINEPTAASLVYHAGQTGRRHLMIYDLGGGTFDVSIVRMEDGVIEVLSSKGDTQLGGDDFDLLLTRFVADRFSTEHGIDLTEDPSTRWRLLQACEQVKRDLSERTTARLSEEFIANVDGKPLNLDLEIERREYEELIQPLIDQTIRCVDEALRDAQLAPAQIDELILVGGSSRTPLVQQRLRDEFQHEPHWAINPDLAVALGAATQAAIQSGATLGPHPSRFSAPSAVHANRCSVSVAVAGPIWICIAKRSPRYLSPRDAVLRPSAEAMIGPWKPGWLICAGSARAKQHSGRGATNPGRTARMHLNQKTRI